MASQEGGVRSRSGGAEPGSTPACADQIIFEIAEGQHGLITRRQLLRGGLSRHIVEHRLRTARLRAVHAGVYRVGPVVSRCAREMAAVLACEGSVLSHRSVAPLWRLAGPRDAREPVELTHADRQSRRPGIRMYRSSLATDEITSIDCIPVTSVARTLLDLSRVSSPREIERALAFADREHPAYREELLLLVDRYRSRSGVRRLRQLLASPTSAALTRSEAEDRLLDLIRSGGLPAPRTNVVVHGFQVDCYWKDARLVVEVDGYAWHGSARAFVRDRKRDAALAAAGVQVLRLSWQQLTGERDRTLVQLTRALFRPERHGM
jgi:very-short-patch-repair endonuclease